MVAPLIEKIILHIGTRKSGSKSIQYALLDARAALEKRGLFVVKQRNLQFRDLYVSLKDGDGRWLEAIDSEVQRLVAAKGHTLIISSEDFYYLSPPKAAELVQACTARARHVVAALFVRRQDQYIDSCYSQYLGAGVWIGNIQQDFARFVASEAAWLDYKENIARWGELIGASNVKATPYVHADTLRAFFELIGAEDLVDDAKRRRNQRLHIDLLRACVLIGEEVAAAKGLELHKSANLNRFFDFRTTVRAALVEKLGDAGYAPFSVLPGAAYEELARRYTKDNQQISDDPAFSRFTPDDKKPYQDLGRAFISPENLPIIFSTLAQSMYALGQFNADEKLRG